MPLVKAIQEVVGQAGFVSGDVGGFVGVGVEVGEVDFVVVEIEFVAVVLDGARLAAIAACPEDVVVRSRSVVCDHGEDVDAVEVVLGWVAACGCEDGGEDVHAHAELVNRFAAFKTRGPAHKGGHADAAFPQGAFVASQTASVAARIGVVCAVGPVAGFA